MTKFINSHRYISYAASKSSRVVMAVVVGASFLFGVATLTSSATAATKTVASNSALPKVKHIWYIIMENKSYDATFTGLNNNTYLWKTLPSQGTLLTNYYGTGHYSQDN